MGGALSPVVYRGLPYHRRVLVPYLLGGGFGGVLLGIGLASIAGAVGVLRIQREYDLVVAAVVAVFAVAEIARWPLPRPNPTRQVPEGLRRTQYVSTTAFLYAADLGTGWTTKQPSSAHLIFSLAVTTLAPVNALLAGVAFGLLRGVVTLGGGWRLSTVERIADRFAVLTLRPRLLALGTASAGLLACLGLVLP